jgi:flavin reductase (DIM6/NTAB) family NADH-FMN oxidoreductase RutF
MSHANQVVTPLAPRCLTSENAADQRRLRDAFGTFATGVVALASELDGRAVGLVASTFVAVSLDPPIASVSISNSSTTWPAMRRAGALGVTVLAADQGEACRALAGPAEHRFEGLDYTVLPSGAVTVAGGLATFECSVLRVVEAGDHGLVLMNIRAYRLQNSSAAPLVVHRSGHGTFSSTTWSGEPRPASSLTATRMEQR